MRSWFFFFKAKDALRDGSPSGGPGNVYKKQLLEFRFGLATAVGLFKGVFGMILLMLSNKLIKRYTETGLY